MRNNRLLFSIILLVTFWSLDLPLAQGQEKLDLDQLQNLNQLSNPRLSPDGSQVLLVLRKADFEENKYKNTLLLIDKSTTRHRALTHDRPGVSQPEWSPDGLMITFLAADSDQRPQIFILPIEGGEARQLTRNETGVIAYHWSPDGRSIAYLARDKAPEKNGKVKHLKAFEVGTDWYLAERSPQPVNLWICTLDGEEHQLTSKSGGLNIFTGGFEWSPDSKKIVYLSQDRPHTGEFIASRLEWIEVESGEMHEQSEKFGLVAPIFSKDGTRILYRKPNGEEPFFVPNGLYMHEVEGEAVEAPLFDLDRNIDFCDFLSDGRILITANHGTQKGMWVGKYDGSYREIDLHGIIANDIHIGATDELVFIGSAGRQPPELYHMQNLDSRPERITSLNQVLADLKLGQVSSINWNTDGFQADGVLTYPPDYEAGRSYPLLLYIHGGPMSASLTGFDFYAQAMASEGWIVFRPNYRGSNNLGKAYQRAVVNDAGAGPGRDVMAGIERLKAMGIVDEDRMAVSGWSYGGFMTVWLTSHYQVWKAAVAGASVTDWFDWYNLADMNRWSGYGLGGSPWLNDNAENYWEQSPISYAHQIQTPMLILHNTKDPRVTVTQSFKLFYNLKDRGVETQFIAYPLPGHFPQDPVHRLDVYRRWIQWIKERL